MYPKSKRIIVTVFCLFLFSLSGTSETYAQQAGYTSLNPPVLLPNGNQFKTWKHQTTYTKSYYVDQGHPRASDDNIGSQMAKNLQHGPTRNKTNHPRLRLS